MATEHEKRPRINYVSNDWVQLKAHVTAKLERERAKNDTIHPTEMTNFIRGRVSILKEILNWENGPSEE